MMEAGRDMNEWRPIEEAPRDGTQVLATWASTWEKNSHHGPHVEVCEFGGYEYWFFSSDGDAPNEDPTHWRPLPAPPGQWRTTMKLEQRKFRDALRHGAVPEDPQERDNAVDAGLCVRDAVGSLESAIYALREAQSLGAAKHVDVDELRDSYRALQRYAAPDGDE